MRALSSSPSPSVKPNLPYLTGVPEDIVPATMKKKRPVAAIPKADKVEDDAGKKSELNIL